MFYSISKLSLLLNMSLVTPGRETLSYYFQLCMLYANMYFSCFIVHSQHNVVIIVYIEEDFISWKQCVSHPLCIIDQLKY